MQTIYCYAVACYKKNCKVICINRSAFSLIHLCYVSNGGVCYVINDVCLSKYTSFHLIFLKFPKTGNSQSHPAPPSFLSLTIE